MKMSSTALCAVIFLACALTFSAAQTSCKGRCGAEYYRGYMCQCDYNCLSYGECCRDYESQCTTKNSCKGRCGEAFRRGRLCSCDSECINYKQCCPDYKTHCDAEEPTLTEAAEQPYSFSEGNDADTYSQNDEFSNNGPEASPVPEGTSDYGSSTADLLDQVSTEPTLEPEPPEFSTETVTVISQTETTPSDNEPTQADDSPSTPYMSSGEAPTESIDAGDPISSTYPGTALPQPTAAADHVSSQTTPTLEPQTGISPTATTPELGQTEGQVILQPEDDTVPEAPKTDPTEASSDKPEVTALPLNTVASTGLTQDYTVLEISEVTTIPASSTVDLTPIPDATTEPDDTESNSEDATAGPPTVLADVQDPSTTVSPVGPGNLSDLDALTTHIPSPTAAEQDDTIDDVTPQVSTTSDPLNVTPDPTKPQPSEASSKPQDKPDPYKPSPPKPTLSKPTSKPETKPVDTAQTLYIDDPRDYQADDSNDTNLCSGRPVSAVTTLRNGTIVVFRGHYFWFLDRNRVPGPARGITQVWGVPSPIDTVFTRCNCQGKTYIFKGSQYWRFENDVLDPGYPKVIVTGFDGLRGHITAALSVPQYQRRKESVYFFKRGGLVQKYSYQYGTSPSCGKKGEYAIYTVRNRMARQAVSLLDPAINIRTSWRGFPSTITAAVSVPNNREPEGYKYYVFSRSKSYNVRMDGERPVIAAPKANVSPQSNDFFKCPQKV
ncbi:proteoglycan 4b isoform X2 [Toxotes jaculatrix]|uniref:proteoglycan 4b isoform X2 n=1 Tax=Toxotes jaculatrix TaxID=941984 RepID=UPI001B3B0118|nr:proteoglycan 4b isoform X2 [Toxotes jaculatrix]